MMLGTLNGYALWQVTMASAFAFGIAGQLAEPFPYWAIRASLLVRRLVMLAKYVGTCRQALPRPMRWALAVALFCTCLPGIPDMGLDETIYAVVGALLWWRHRRLVRTCWHAAVMEVAS